MKINSTHCYINIVSKRLTTKEFIIKANKKHNNKYDYSLVNYIKNNIKINIICKEHGLFLQTPNSHLSGKGCKLCSLKITNLNDFIKQANIVHNNKYDYSKIKYTTIRKKGIIICSIHGEFLQILSKHIYSKNGCSQCSKNKKYTTEEFIKNANKKHNNKYLYDKTKYINNNTFIIITCHKHGDFKQLPLNHLKGNGCPKCYGKISKKEQQWLETIENNLNRKILRQFRLPNLTYICDGYDPKTNTVYEYHGDYWHGNPKRFDHNKINKSNGMSFKELYSNTIFRENEIKKAGYNLIVKWET